MEDKKRISNRRVIIKGEHGAGKTTALKKCVEELRGKREVRIISINCDRSELVDQVDAVTTNTFSIAPREKYSPDISLLDTGWQDIEFDRNVVYVPTEFFKSLSKKISEFVDGNDTPCVIIVENLELFRDEAIRCLMELAEYVVLKGGYSMQTFTPDLRIDLLLSKDARVVDLDIAHQLRRLDLVNESLLSVD
jgi:uridine kinase